MNVKKDNREYLICQHLASKLYLYSKRVNSCEYLLFMVGTFLKK